MSDDPLLSDDEEADHHESSSAPSFAGKLSKWTNYIHGWQDRYFVLSDGALTYFKSENERSFGCRGAISIQKTMVKLHEFDECRFDISVSDCVWYLRADTVDMRNKWVEVLEIHRQHIDSAYGSDQSLRRHGSAISLGSASINSLQKSRGLREKLAEVETFRDILCRQVDTLQTYFDLCAEAFGNSKVNGENETADGEIELESVGNENGPTNGSLKNLTVTKELSAQHGQLAVDFKGEAITFKATTAGIVATLSHCIEMMQQREECWKKKCEKEIERRKKLEEQIKQSIVEATAQKVIIIGGPDYEEGPHSILKEEEFFDALESALDRNDQEEEQRRQLKLRTKELSSPSAVLPTTCQHPLWPEIERVTLDQLYHAQLEIGEGGPKGWELFAEDGDMRLYKRELEIDGLVCDPLKAVHTVKGVTGHEVCQHFFSPDVRFDWENTLDSMNVVEEINPNTLIFHQIHKRVWPAAQRDTVFWSHIRRIAPKDSHKESADLQDVWIVCNHSADRPDIPLGRCVRMTLTVSLVCETYMSPAPADGSAVTRDNLTCKIIYSSTINPGGWAPASVLRALYKREYPKFLKRFTQYVKDATENKPIMF